MANLSTVIPSPNTPMVDPGSGVISPQWWFVFQRLIARTGGQAGSAFMPISGGTFTGPVAHGSNLLSGSNIDFTGGSIDGTTIGTTTKAAGSFTTLSASGVVSGVGFTSLLAPYATLASPALTGIPTMPTAAPGTNTTQGATTAFVQNAVGSGGSSGSFTSLSASGTVSGAGFVAFMASPPSIGSTAPAAGAFTTLSASSTVSGAGFTAWAASPPAIGGTAPAAGAFTNLSSTGTFTPAQVAGIVGTTTNNNAQSGSVGEYISSSVPVGSAVSLTTGIAANVTSISLTAGDWDVSGNMITNPNAATITQNVHAAIGTTSASLPTAPNGGAYTSVFAVQTAGVTVGLPAGTTRISLASTTTVYLIAQVGFTTNVLSAYGFIGARRVR